MKKKLTLLYLWIITFIVFAPVSVFAGPTDEVKPTLDNIITILTDPGLKGDEHKDERRSKVMGIIKKRFDFNEMSMRVLGSTWDEISPADRDHFTELMTKLLENVYIGKLESYSGQKIDYVGEKIKENKALVSTTIENNDKKIPLHYILIHKSSKWMVYDINIDGVSLVKNYRQQFKAVLKRDNFSGLVKELEQMNKDLAGES